MFQRNDYVLVYDKDKQQYRKLHVIIWEIILQRPLTQNEVIHHKNGDKSDNRLCNLELQNRSIHTKNHKPWKYKRRRY